MSYRFAVHTGGRAGDRRRIMQNFRLFLAHGVCIVALAAAAGIHCSGKPPASSPAIAMLSMTVTLDSAAPGQPGKIGDVDRLRIVYDANAIDPKTKRVKLLNLQHFTGGQYVPPSPDPAVMPTDDAWLETGSIPYRLHYKASVVHGQPIIIEFDENSRRLTIRAQNDPAAVLESGPYRIDSGPAQQ
jgi:hypothetical protein